MNPFVTVASVAYGRPPLEQRIWAEIAADSDFVIKSNVLKFLSIHRAGTGFLKESCVRVLLSDGHDFDRVSPLDVAVEIIGDQFASDPELMQRILSAYPGAYLRHSQVVALCAGWPESDVVGELYGYTEKNDTQSVFGPDAYYAIVFARCPVAVLSERLIRAIQHVSRRPMYTGRMVWSLLRRLRKDEVARLELERTLSNSTDVGLKNNILALLSLAGKLTDQQIATGAEDLRKQQQQPEGSRIAYDLMSEQYQSVVIGLMDRIGDRLAQATSR